MNSKGMDGKRLIEISAYAGEDTMNPVALEIIRESRRLELRDFRVGDDLVKDDEVVQRITEGAWPITYSLRSTNTFLLQSSSMPGHCNLVSTGNLVKYATCLQN